MSPRFLFVDDKVEEIPIERFTMIAPELITRVSPDTVEVAMLEDADVVLVDFVIDEWRSQALAEDRFDPALLPANGLGLIATFRSIVETSNLNRRLPAKAFALLTAEPQNLSPLRGSQREHAIARIRDLEWVFEKPAVGTGWENLERKLVSLGAAVERLPSRWPTNKDAVSDVRSLLALDAEKPWSSNAWSEVVAARAPINELYNATHGNVFLRWLLHRSLPYPGVFLDDIYLAARLRTTSAKMQAALSEKPMLRDALASTKYEGILADFGRPHYWRAGVETALWNLTSGRPFDAIALAELIDPWNTQVTGEAVVCLDGYFNPDASQLYAADSVLRVLPDDWPPFADQPYMTRDVILDNPDLAGIVDAEDRDVLL